MFRKSLIITLFFIMIFYGIFNLAITVAEGQLFEESEISGLSFSKDPLGDITQYGSTEYESFYAVPSIDSSKEEESEVPEIDGSLAWELRIAGPTTYGDLLTYEELQEIEMMIMYSPPIPPPGVQSTIVTDIPQSAVMLSDVPTSRWTYGCSATSAGIMVGYYDRNGFPNMYAGPTNGGVAPLTDLGQGIGSTPIPGSCSIIATQNAFDGRTVRGHVDDYWTGNGDPGPDPWEGHWTEHAWEGCTADFMGTNQWKWDFSPWPSGDGVIDTNIDGATILFYACTKLYDFVPPSALGQPQTALCHGLRLFTESRGYTVVGNYSQKVDSQCLVGGFSFADYMKEIDNGYPVMIQVVGHSMVGVGYDEMSQTVYLHDAWDNNVHQMTWGTSYSGMDLQAVTVIHPSVGQGGWETAYTTLFDSSSDLELLREYRDKILSRTTKGRMYEILIYKSSDEALKVLLDNPELMLEAKYLIEANKDAVSEVLNGNEGVIYNTDEIISFLHAYARKAPPALKVLALTIKREMLKERGQDGLFFDFRLK